MGFIITGSSWADTFGGSSGTTGQLAAGHFWDPTGLLNDVFTPMALIYPRHSESNTFARHRKYYYDGVNAVEYSINIGVQYGAWPYWYEITQGPSWLTIGQTYGTSDYGRIHGIPTSSGTNVPVTVLVHDQLGNTLSVSWTISSSSSTSDFVFWAASGGSLGNPGTISLPKAGLSSLFGAAVDANTFPNAIAYLRAGTYSAFDQTSSGGFGMKLSNGHSPSAIIGFPGESVSIDISGGGQLSCINTGTGGDDLFLKNLTFTGAVASSTWSYYHIRMGGVENRFTFDELHFPDAYAGASLQDNSSCIEGRDGGGVRTYMYINSCTTTNYRINSGGSGGNNAWGLSNFFGTNHILVDNCSDTGNRGERGLCYAKASCLNVEIRNSTLTMSGTTVGVLTGQQVQTALSPNDIGPMLLRHLKVDAKAGGGSIVLDESQAGAGTKTKQHAIVRCTAIGALGANGPATASYGPYLLQDNVVQTSLGTLVQRNYANQTLGNYVTSTGNVGGASGYIDTTTLNLTGSARTTYLGLKGAEVA